MRQLHGSTLQVKLFSSILYLAEQHVNYPAILEEFLAHQIIGQVFFPRAFSGITFASLKIAPLFLWRILLLCIRHQLTLILSVEIMTSEGRGLLPAQGFVLCSLTLHAPNLPLGRQPSVDPGLHTWSLHGLNLAVIGASLLQPWSSFSKTPIRPYTGLDKFQNTPPLPLPFQIKENISTLFTQIL